MTGIRRGSSKGDLQFRTVMGVGAVDFPSGVSGSEMYTDKMLDVSPPPAVDWKVHGIHIFGSILPRNPTSEEVTAKPRTMMALSYDEDLAEGAAFIDADQRNFMEEDQVIWAHFQEQFQPFQGAPALDTANVAGPGQGFQVDDVYEPFDDQPFTLSDMEELHLIGAMSYPTDSTTAGGERTGHFRGGVTVYYKPEN